MSFADVRKEKQQNRLDECMCELNLLFTRHKNKIEVWFVDHA